jgi:hypothetical protein
MDSLDQMQEICDREFRIYIVSSSRILNKLRFVLIDESFVEVFMSMENPGRWAFHWERRHIDGKIYRHDNIPHKVWSSIRSFPWHYHEASEIHVVESDFTEDPIINVRKFFVFIKSQIESI